MKTIKQIAAELNVSSTTVRNHLQKLPRGLSAVKERNVYKIDTKVEEFLKDSILKNMDEELMSEKPRHEEPDMEKELLKKRIEEISKDKENLYKKIEKKDEAIQDFIILFQQHQKLQLDVNKEILKYKKAMD